MYFNYETVFQNLRKDLEVMNIFSSLIKLLKNII